MVRGPRRLALRGRPAERLGDRAGYSKGKTAAEKKAWELAAEYADLFSVTTVHPAVVLGPMLPGQAVSSTMGLLKQLLDGKVVPSTFGLCSAADVAAVLSPRGRSSDESRRRRG